MAMTCSRSPLIGPNVAPHFPHLNEVRPSKRSEWASAVSSCGQKHERLRIMPEAPKVQRHLTPWNKSFLYSSQFGPLELRGLNREAAKRAITNTAAIKSRARSQTGTGTWLNTNHDRNHETVDFIQDQTPGIKVASQPRIAKTTTAITVPLIQWLFSSLMTCVLPPYQRPKLSRSPESFLGTAGPLRNGDA